MLDASIDSAMEAEQRLHDVADILAQGVLRYHRRIGRLEADCDENLPNSFPRGLEVPGGTRLTVPQRIGG